MSAALPSVSVKLVINLAKRPDRMERFRQMGDCLPFTVTRLQAVEPGPYSGACGNLHSFYTAACIGMTTKAKRMLIFEDDARLRSGALDHLAGVEAELDALGDRWDMYMLGVGAKKPVSLIPHSPHTALVVGCGGTQAVILNRSGMEILAGLALNSMEDARKHIQRTGKMPDVWMTTALRTYLHQPLLFDQEPSWSDVSHHKADHTHGINRFETETLQPAFAGA